MQAGRKKARKNIFPANSKANHKMQYWREKNSETTDHVGPSNVFEVLSQVEAAKSEKLMDPDMDWRIQIQNGENIAGQEEEANSLEKDSTVDPLEKEPNMVMEIQIQKEIINIVQEIEANPLEKDFGVEEVGFNSENAEKDDGDDWSSCEEGEVSDQSDCISKGGRRKHQNRDSELILEKGDGPRKADKVNYESPKSYQNLPKAMGANRVPCSISESDSEDQSPWPPAGINMQDNPDWFRSHCPKDQRLEEFLSFTEFSRLNIWSWELRAKDNHQNVVIHDH